MFIVLRHFLDSAGQRFFDCYKLTSFDTAFKELKCIWGPRQTVFNARRTFTRLPQECVESVVAFIVKLLKQVQTCEYKALNLAKIRGAMLIQQLITGIEGEKCREFLLNEDATSITWEKACSLVFHKAALKSQPHSFTERSTLFTPAIYQVKSTLAHARSNSLRVGGARLDCGFASHWANSELGPAVKLGAFNAAFSTAQFTQSKKRRRRRRS